MSRRLVVALLAAFVALSLPAPVQAARTPGALVGPVRLVPRGSGPIHVSGLHGYFGQVGIAPASDGLVVTNRLPLERYLLGLQEVPPSWPDEALRAQAVAARTYALWTLSRPRAGAAATYGFDICASVECQVFSGADVVATPDGQRWAAAVQSTADEAVLYEGNPILARYHSTSGGATLDNPQAFPGEPDYPYLQGVPSRTEQGSPLYRWTVRFPLQHLQAMLTSGGLWTGAHGQMRRAVTVRSSSGLHYPDVVLTGTRKNLRVDAESVRDIVRTQGPALYPGVYPSRWFTTSGRLPETLPANRISIVTRKGVAVVTGRGWGHGTGMSQWGAHGLAEQGASYREILAHYYTGTTVGEVDAPASISVGVAWARSSVVATGAFDIVDGRGDVAVRDALGSWTFTPGGGGVVRVDPPEGHSLPLRVGIVAAPKRAEPGERVPITVALSKPARLQVGSGDASVHRAGRGRVFWKAPRDPGSYEVTLVASSGPGESQERRLDIRVVAQEGATSAPIPPREGDGGVGGGLLRLLVGAVLIGLVIAGLGSRIK
ncbi:MAG TPA: SpoIID/LytB domain-containing protein [Actinomycetota bacterium]|nr:SpoIID/LytB domain-containing protein [Actinomycetota bacterium]